MGAKIIMNLFGIGPGELILVAVIALIVFGPDKLPEIMGRVGRTIAEFQRISSQLSKEFNDSLQAELAETKAVVEETKAAVQETKAAVEEAHASVATSLAAPQLTSSPTSPPDPASAAPPPAAPPPTAPELAPAPRDGVTVVGSNGTLSAPEQARPGEPPAASPPPSPKDDGSLLQPPY